MIQDSICFSHKQFTAHLLPSHLQPRASAFEREFPWGRQKAGSDPPSMNAKAFLGGRPERPLCTGPCVALWLWLSYAAAKDSARGVSDNRLQNLVITLNKVTYCLRQKNQMQGCPLTPLTEEEVRPPCLCPCPCPRPCP